MDASMSTRIKPLGSPVHRHHERGVVALCFASQVSTAAGAAAATERTDELPVRLPGIPTLRRQRILWMLDSTRLVS
jgi:hypothetical protein